MIPLAVLSVLVWAALIIAAAAPVILIALFFIDYKRKEIW